MAFAIRRDPFQSRDIGEIPTRQVFRVLMVYLRNKTTIPVDNGTGTSLRMATQAIRPKEVLYGPSRMDNASILTVMHSVAVGTGPLNPSPSILERKEVNKKQHYYRKCHQFFNA